MAIKKLRSLNGEQFSVLTSQCMTESPLRLITAGLFEHAKRWWALGFVSKTLLALCGFALPYFPDLTIQIAVIVLVLELSSSIGFLRADILKVRAEPILTKLDYQESLGWIVPQEIVDEILADHGRTIAMGAHVRRGDPYFAPGAIPVGLARLRANILESALYTRSVSLSARTVVFGAFGLILAAVIFVLITGVYHHLAEGKDITAEFVTDALILIVALELFPLGLRYGELAAVAGSTRLHMSRMPDSPAVSELIPSVVQYQIARAAAPLLPTFTFIARRLPLATIWSSHGRRGDGGDT